MTTVDTTDGEAARSVDRSTTATTAHPSTSSRNSGTWTTGTPHQEIHGKHGEAATPTATPTGANGTSGNGNGSAVSQPLDQSRAIEIAPALWVGVISATGREARGDCYPHLAEI